MRKRKSSSCIIYYIHIGFSYVVTHYIIILSHIIHISSYCHKLYIVSIYVYIIITHYISLSYKLFELKYGNTQFLYIPSLAYILYHFYVRTMGFNVHYSEGFQHHCSERDYALVYSAMFHMYIRPLHVSAYNSTRSTRSCILAHF